MAKRSLRRHPGFWDRKRTRTLGKNEGNMNKVWTVVNDNVSVSFINWAKCTILMYDVNNGKLGGGVCWNSLYCLCNYSVSLKLF